MPRYKVGRSFGTHELQYAVVWADDLEAAQEAALDFAIEDVEAWVEEELTDDKEEDDNGE